MNEVYTTPATGTPLDRMGPYGPSGFFERGLLMEAKLFGELMRASHALSASMQSGWRV